VSLLDPPIGSFLWQAKLLGVTALGMAMGIAAAVVLTPVILIDAIRETWRESR
jgi:hypothetical protein